MAKKETTTIKPHSNKKVEEAKKKAEENMTAVGRTEIASFAFGFLLVVVALFLFISFCSYIYSGAVDFDKMENTSAAEWINENNEIKNVCGVLGAKCAYFFIQQCFGLASFVMLPYLIILGFRLMRINKNMNLVRRFILMTLFMLWTSILLATIRIFIPGTDSWFLSLGGNHGEYIVRRASALVGIPGLLALLGTFATFYLIYMSAKTIEHIRNIMRLNFFRNKLAELRKHRSHQEENQSAPTDDTSNQEANIDESDSAISLDESKNIPNYQDDNSQNILIDETPNANTVIFGPDEINNIPPFEETIENIPDDSLDEPKKDIELEIEVNNEEKGSGNIERGNIDTPYDPKLDLENYKYPPIELVNTGAESTPAIDMSEQSANKDRITHVLKSFGVEISSIKATIGPTITLYEITPAEGTRINRIRNLEDDIALSLAAEGIRIIAPIPGKGTIGIEVPNKKKCIVGMDSLLNSKTYQESTMELPCAIGKTITNEVYMFDLAKAPHLLVAGATGQGKSVGLNAIITSLLYKKHPAELKIVMVDPKKVEFSIYSPIENHFLARLEEEEECIITDVQKVVKTLNSLCQLMDTRYDLLKKASVRNIKEYNAKFKARQLNPEHGHDYMPYVVVIIDEFGDLIMTAGKEIELPICRIAQLARAVGIHMIIATQRPTTQIITGTIKANFPARIAFKVSSMMDSRVILDRPGANQLIGRGDMLYTQGNDPVRVQCAFVDTPEVNKVCSFIAQQQSYPTPMYLPDVVTESEMGGGGMIDKSHLDPMFAEVARFVVNSQNGSTSMIQRNFSIGYNRAGKIMDQLEKMGIVGAQNGAKPRELLVQDPLTLDSILNNLG